jgi:hypothetical protein
METDLDEITLPTQTVQVPFWPYPSGAFSIGSTQLTVDGSFAFQATYSDSNSLLAEAYQRYLALIWS